MNETAKEHCLQDFLRYSLSSVLGMLGLSCYILADTFFIAAATGADGLTALNLALPVYNLIHGCGLMFGMGGATKFSILLGQGEKREADKLFTNTVILTAVTAALFVIVGALFTEPLASFFGSSGSVYPLTVIYLRWLLLFAPSFMANDVLLGFIRNDGKPKLAMASMMISSFSNILLDYIFIFPLQMGIFGAIFATGLSPLIGVFIMLLGSGKPGRGFHLKKALPNLRLSAQLMSLGFPSLLGQVSSGVVMVVFNFLTLSLAGNTGVAAYGVVANFAMIIVSVYTGVAQGAQPLLSENYGSGSRTAVQKLMKYSLVTVAVLSLLFYAGTSLFSGPLVAMFNGEGNAMLQSIAEEGMWLYFLSNIFVGYNTIVATYFTSVDVPAPAQFLSLLRGILLLVPFAFLLAFVFGMRGVWLSYPAAEAVTAVAGYFLMKKLSKK